jgi:RHS repeat-associated protein
MLSPNGGFRFAGLNRHGDVAFQASYFGAVDYLTEYDPFGGVYARTGLTTQPTAGFQGDFTDPASGNVLMGSRWYTPGTGTFASRDTHDGEADAPATLNRYTYANGDPLDFVDPDGLCGFSLSGLVDCAKDAGHAVYSAGQYAVNTVRSAYDATVGVVRQGFDYVRNAVTATAQFVNSTFATTYRGVTQAMGTAFRSTWSAVQSSARNAGALVRGGLATLQHAGASAWRATTSCLGAGGACRTVLVVAAVVAVGIACTACMIGAAAGAALGGAFGAAFCPPQNKIGCIGRAALGGAVAGVTAPLGGGLLADAGLGARTIAVISGFTSGIAAEGSAQFVAGDFDAKRLAVAGASGAIVAGAIATAAPAARSLLGRARGTAVAERLPQDIGVNPEPPPAKRLNRPIGLSATQNAAVQRDIVELQAMRASDIRVNQQQVNAAGVRVGTNRPDLQYTLDGKRFYVEYERPGSPRWPGHQARLEANDPAGVATMKEQR